MDEHQFFGKIKKQTNVETMRNIFWNKFEIYSKFQGGLSKLPNLGRISVLLYGLRRCTYDELGRHRMPSSDGHVPVCSWLQHITKDTISLHVHFPKTSVFLESQAGLKSIDNLFNQPIEDGFSMVCHMYHRSKNSLRYINNGNASNGCKYPRRHNTFCLDSFQNSVDFFLLLFPISYFLFLIFFEWVLSSRANLTSYNLLWK